MCVRDGIHSRYFVLRKEAPIDTLPWGPHYWSCKPGLVETRQLLVVQVDMPPGTAHAFHLHPGREEVLWIIKGQAEQWVDRKKMLLNPGDSAFIPPDTVHGIYNDSQNVVRFLAILSPAETGGPMSIDVKHQQPWASLRSQI